MTYRLQFGCPVEYKGPEELDAVQWAIRRRDDTFALAMAFDPGDTGGEALMVHGVDVMLGLMWIRGWRHEGQAFQLGRAAGWTDRWWDRPLGPRAFIVESDLAPAGATDAEDVTRIVSLATVAWSMEREMSLRDRPIPDLMAAFAPDGVVLASIHPEALLDAIRPQGESVLERMATLPEPARSATHAHVLAHLEGGTVLPWSLPGRSCAFGSASVDPTVDRVFVALRDTAEDPQPETARALLRLMLASAAAGEQSTIAIPAQATASGSSGPRGAIPRSPRSPSPPKPQGVTEMSERTHHPPSRDDTPCLGLYLDAETEGSGATHDRLTALALLPFTFDTAWIILPRLDDALSCPDPHRPGAAGADARAPSIDLARARALVERAHLVVTHTGGFCHALLGRLLPGLADLPWLAWELGLPDPDGSVSLPVSPSRGLAACKSALWLLAQRDATTDRPMLALLVEQSAAAPATPPAPERLQ